MAAELLMSAAQREITTLDEKLYLQVYGNPKPTLHGALRQRADLPSQARSATKPAPQPQSLTPPVHHRS